MITLAEADLDSGCRSSQSLGVFSRWSEPRAEAERARLRDLSVIVAPEQNKTIFEAGEDDAEPSEPPSGLRPHKQSQDVTSCTIS